MPPRVEGDPKALLEAVPQQAAKSAGGNPAPAEIAKCIQAAVTMPFDEGRKIERERFQYLVNTTESSFPFIEELSRKERVVITATDSTAQRYATVFPEYLVRALADPATDADKDGRISLWEAFSYASAGVRTYYERRGQLSTERPLLDDDGDRIGREFQALLIDGVSNPSPGASQRLLPEGPEGGTNVLDASQHQP